MYLNGPGLTIVHYAMLSLDTHTVCIMQCSGIIIMGLNTLTLLRDYRQTFCVTITGCTHLQN